MSSSDQKLVGNSRLGAKMQSLLPETRLKIGVGRLVSLLSQMAVVRTAYLSARHRGRFIVARGTRVKMGAGAKVSFAPGSCLFMGFEHFTPTPSSMHLGKGARVTVEGTVQIMRGTRIFVNDGALLEFGLHTFINDCCTITCFEHVKTGARCGISWNVNITDTNVHELVIDGRPRPRSAPVTLGSDLWIGTGVIILAGADVGSGSVVAAGSVVTTNIPAGVIAGGNPARVIREEVSWNL